jgi:hypothetical protein
MEVIMRARISTHSPSPTLWIVALILFIYGVLPLPYSTLALIVSALLLLLATTIL